MEQFGRATLGHHHADRIRSLRETDYLTVEFHIASELTQPVQQDLVGTPLRHQPKTWVWDAWARGDVGPEHLHQAALGDDLMARVDAEGRHGHAPAVDRRRDTEIVEHLLGARGQALAARTGEQIGSLVQHPACDAAPRQFAGQRQTRGAGPGDHHRHRAPGRIRTSKTSSTSRPMNASSRGPPRVRRWVSIASATS
ncbi:Uncharacterised protein [Mycobacteroides abscessus]|nr:Uncharacterised protein [Mycobacteroides abscessus]